MFKKRMMVDRIVIFVLLLFALASYVDAGTVIACPNCNNNDQGCFETGTPWLSNEQCSPSGYGNNVVGFYHHHRKTPAGGCDTQSHQGTGGEALPKMQCNAGYYCDGGAITALPDGTKYGTYYDNILDAGTYSGMDSNSYVNALDAIICKTPDQSQWVCNNAISKQWVAGQCCESADFYASGNQLCNLGTSETCNSNIEGQARSSGGTSYVCTQGQWVAGTAETVCTSSGGDWLIGNNIETNRCCGNDAVRNPGFEDVGARWVQGVQGSWDYVTSSSSTYRSPPHSGTYSFVLDNGATFLDNYWYQDIAVNITASYTISGYIKTFGVAGSAPGRGAMLHAVSGTTNYFSKVLTGSNDWTFVNMTFTPTTSTIRLYLQLGYGTAAANGTAWFDDIFIISPTDPTKTDLGYLTKSSPTTIDDVMCVYDNTQYKWANASELDVFKIYPIDNNHDVISNAFSSTSSAWFSCNLNTTLYNLPSSFTPGQLLTNISPGLPGGGTWNQSSSTTQPTNTTFGGTQIIPGDDFFNDVEINFTSGTSGTATSSGATLLVNPIIFSNISQSLIFVGISGFNGSIIQPNSIQLIDSNSVAYSTVHTSKNISAPTGNFTALNVNIPALKPDIYDVKITTENSTGYQFIYNFTDLLTATPTQTPGTPIFPQTDRFLCYKENNYGAIAECCGFSFQSCLNQQPSIPNPYSKTKRAGEVISTLQDFFDPTGNPTKNYVARIFFEKNVAKPSQFFTTPSNGLRLPAKKDLTTDYLIRIQDWRSYDTLEFDIAFTNSNDLTLYIFNLSTFTDAADSGIPSGDIRTLNRLNLNKSLFTAKVKYYSIDGFNLKKWHHIIIPLGPFGLKKKDIALMYFSQEQSSINSAPSVTLYPNNVIYGIDRIFLGRYSEENTHLRFCGYTGTWLLDLDNESVACDNTVTSRWTGQKCCGDDQGRRNSTGGKIFENYNDAVSGCWNGMNMRNDQVVNITIVPPVNITGVGLGGIVGD